MKKFLTIFMLSTLCLVLGVVLSTSSGAYALEIEPREELIEHDFGSLLPNQEISSYISYSNFRDELNNYIAQNPTNINQVIDLIDENIVNENKIIRIDTAQELYRFSVDVSYLESIKYELEITKLPLLVRHKLLELDYALGNHIDYSVMKSRQFIPIGYRFETIDAVEHVKYFEGTFNGMGFAISNLYVAGFNALHILEGELETEIETVITPYYAMFTHNRGVITNFGLINPTFELRVDHDDLTKAANIVGKNDGLVEKVYVIDDRSQADAGFRMKTPVGATTSSYEAAGIVYENTNLGQIKNSYFASRVVVNQSNINAFSVQPVVYKNSGLTTKLVYDNQIYLTQINVGGSNVNVTAVSSLHTGESTSTLKSQSSLGNQFFYYPQDGYPKLIGLTYVDNQFQIHNAFEFKYFNLMINYQSTYLGKNYRQHHYKLVNNINMDDLSKNTYQTPQVEFEGILSGYKNANENYHVYNLNIQNGTTISGSYYLGLFAVLKGEVKDINFGNLNLNYKDTQNNLNVHSFVAGIAAKLDNGKVTNVLMQIETNFGNDQLGSFSYGSVSAYASGQIQSVLVEGEVDLGNHTGNTNAITFESYVGGLVGRTSNRKLTIYNGLNRAKLSNFGTSSQANYTANTSIYFGGVIGYVDNISGQINDFGLITNEAELIVRSISSNRIISIFMAGVIGESNGASYILNNLSGIWTNKGKLNLTSRDSNPVQVSGVVNSNHNFAVEFIYLENKKPSELLINNYTNFKFAALIYHRGSGNVTLSQSINEMDVEFTTPLNAEYSGVFHTEQNTQNLLRYVENSGSIIFRSFTTNQTFVVAGITTATNTDFLNVIQSGEIAVYNITFNPTTNNTSVTYNATSNQNDRNLWIAGITQTLTSGRYIKNSFNDGAIYVSDILAEGNIYVAGIVNRNLSGDLHLKDSDNIPKATYGILNTVNNADILSTLPSKYNHSNYGIRGKANTYVGGITTFNGDSTGGSIQDTINMADLMISHIQTSGESDSVNFNDDLGGAVSNYRRGVIIGGIAASVNNGYSRIFDSVNSGNMIAYSAYFARTGGVLAIALREELLYGNINSSLFTLQTSATNAQTILNSKLSNGLNYGNISSVTLKIGEYSTSSASMSYRYLRSTGSSTNTLNFLGPTNSSFSTSLTGTSATEDRPGVRSASGGVIGYGLSTMSKMLNHGQISATDVAGGVVGATVVIATFDVNIDTAINYGTVRAVKSNLYNSLDKKDFNYSQIKSAFYDVNDSFIFPDLSINQAYLSIVPNDKRGIGGVFGRLQRTTSQYMRSTGGVFDYVVNMDPNVDLIGRLDQVYDFSSSNRFFIFNNAKYYSAKLNDTTQAIFAGHRYKQGQNNNPINRRTVTRTVVEKARYEYRIQNGVVQRKLQNLTLNVREYEMGGGTTSLHTGNAITTITSTTEVIRREVLSQSWQDASGWTNTNEIYSGQYSDLFNVNKIITNEVVLSNSNSTPTSNITSGYYYFGANPIPFITENQEVENGSYIYDPSFEMRNDSTTVNGKPITSYIYFVENDVLGSRFINNRPNGMYVLATSAGSQFGAALPANIKLDQIFRLNSYLPYNIDYEKINQNLKTSFDEEVINEYLSLFQTSMNDKSKLLTTSQLIKLQNNNQTISIYGNEASVNNNTNEITLRLNASTSVYSGSIILEMVQAVIPNNAKLAKTLADAGYSSNPDLYRNALLNEGLMNVSSEFKPEFSVPRQTSGTYNVGKFTSYSEAAMNLGGLFTNPNYYTEYTLYIQFYNSTSITPSIYTNYLDGSQTASGPNSTTNTSDNVTFTTAFSNQIRTVFRISGTNAINNSVITIGYDIKDSFKLHYELNGNYYEIPSSYYTLETIPFRNISGTTYEFEFSLTLSELLKGGNYRITYRYGSTDRFYTITKAMRSNNQIIELSHETESIIYPMQNTISSNIDFDYDLFKNFSGSYASTIDPSVPVYLDNYIHNIPFLTQLKLDPFARISSVSVGNPTYNNGYKSFVVSYTVVSEAGQQSVYQHTITERPFSISAIYKDNIAVNINELTALREAVETIFGVNFSINQSLFSQIMHLEDTNVNQHFDYVISARYPNNTTMPASEIKGVYLSIDNNLNIHVGNETLPGTYTITLIYIRNGRQTTISPNIVITKIQGTSSYLTDIRFAENSNDTDYPSINVANNLGAIIPSPYLPNAYFAGIDYDGANLQNVRHFRVDGTVANIPLSEYSPLLLDYLPSGATIARLVNPTNNTWTQEINKDSSQTLKDLLLTNYTLKYDGSEPTDEEEVIITYRVTSEDGLTQTYYHTTVIDKTYNFSIVFEVYYGSISPSGSLEVTRLKHKTIAIQVTNFTAKDINGNYIPFTTPATDGFPSFASIGEIESTVSMFYSGVDPNIYRYRFGRNKSGFYNFDVILPEETLTYQIRYNGETLSDTPFMSGKYFYIINGNRNRTRAFQILISENPEAEKLWGLYDYRTDWN